MKAITFFLICIFFTSSNLFGQNIGEFTGYYTGWDFHQNNSPATYFEMVSINNGISPTPVFVVGSKLIYRSGDNNWQFIQPIDSPTSSIPTMQFCKGGPFNGKILVSNISSVGTFFSVIDPTDW